MTQQIPTYEEFVRLALQRIEMAEQETSRLSVAEHHRAIALVYATLAAGVTPNIDLARTRVFETVVSDGTDGEVGPEDGFRLVSYGPVLHPLTGQPTDIEIVVSDDTRVQGQNGERIVEAPATTLKATDGPVPPADPNCPATECGHSAKAHHSTHATNDFGCKFCSCPRSRERVIRVTQAIGSERL